ncbi:MAG: Asp-tRNA(Asn)/Glu-tRNA(Gln) amidotransferase subunit GatC [Gammaproteobacteria bacterium]
MPDIPEAEGEKEIGAEDLARLARLSRLRLSPAEAADAARAVNDVLRMMRRLQFADVSGEDDTAHVQFWGNTLRLRDDVARPGYDPDELMKGAPSAAGGCFIVPKVLE